MNESAQGSKDRQGFICGVIEGFYGRPWTTEQRKDLFRKLKKWGMDSYVYAPKDDYKHRAFWREMYTVEEADHLSSLIAAAKEHDVTFYYALSPGLDMSYSSQKEIQTLKRKLDQVSQFGCEAFALLFDDIESELSKADKEVFQTFANAQVSVTNDIYVHLGSPRFLFCPTQYCSSRAIPTVPDSEYLNTLGSKLNNDIDIMWTGTKVISKIITIESIQEITEVLRRPPVIWDNLHANDYDQKRVFLGPYSGRAPELIPHLRGVMTNPNCEFHANTIAIHTLAHWSQCSIDAKVNSTLSANIKLETENEDGSNNEALPTDCGLLKNVYHPRVALRNAIEEWLPEFFVEKEAWGPITKPQPQLTIMPIIPIIPSINTCMSLTTTTTTTSTVTKTITSAPEGGVSTQLQALADVCSTVNSSASSALNPIANPVMNSLVSATKVVTNDDILNPIPTSVASSIELPKQIPISVVSVPIMQDAEEVSDVRDMLNVAFDTKNSEHQVKLETEKFSDNAPAAVDVNLTPPVVEAVAQQSEDVAIEEDIEKTPSSEGIDVLQEQISRSPSAETEPMECSSSLQSQGSPVDEKTDAKAEAEDIVMVEATAAQEQNSMQVESAEASPQSSAEMKEDEDKTASGEQKITADDVHLLCDLFYLPFEHGSRGLKLLNEFNWLKANSTVLLNNQRPLGKKGGVVKPEVTEWHQRAEGFGALCDAVQLLLTKVAECANKEICHDLFSYVWDVAGSLTLLNAFVKWLRLGHFSPKVYTYTQGGYTWFTKGWKDAFMSGDQEPWVFRGGLTADLQRLMPAESGDLFLYKVPELPTSEYHLLRPYTPPDEGSVTEVSTRSFMRLRLEEADEMLLLPNELCELIADSTIGPFVTLHPEMVIVAHDMSGGIMGYAAAAKDVNLFVRNVEISWMPCMQEKYPKTLLEDTQKVAQWTPVKECNELLAAMIRDFYDYNYECPVEVFNTYPGIITTGVVDNALTRDGGVLKRLLTMSMATLRANGCFGVHIRIPLKDQQLTQYYTKIGFAEVFRDSVKDFLYMGRRF